MADNNEFIIDYDNLIRKTAVFEDLAKEIDKLEKRLIELGKIQKAVIDNLNPSDVEGIKKSEKEIRILIVAF